MKELLLQISGNFVENGNLGNSKNGKRQNLEKLLVTNLIEFEADLLTFGWFGVTTPRTSSFTFLL